MAIDVELDLSCGDYEYVGEYEYTMKTPKALISAKPHIKRSGMWGTDAVQKTINVADVD